MRWEPGTGTPEPDLLRLARTSASIRRSTPYFTELYTQVGLELRGMEAREHTAQVPSAIREEREDDFREGNLAVLYCSPTMELGVDIADLNAVNMRNVPPTPANYAQRSGRAGRSGQPALVVTYCSSSRPHDQYFFRRQPQMVAGAVSPPRIDLANEDLVRSHFQAVWLAETGQNLGSSSEGHARSLATGRRSCRSERRFPARHLPASMPGGGPRVRCQTLLGRASSGAGQAPSWYTPTWLDDVIERRAAHLRRRRATLAAALPLRPKQQRTADTPSCIDPPSARRAGKRPSACAARRRRS